jgi:hypothetical protein
MRKEAVTVGLIAGAGYAQLMPFTRGWANQTIKSDYLDDMVSIPPRGL